MTRKLTCTHVLHCTGSCTWRSVHRSTNSWNHWWYIFQVTHVKYVTRGATSFVPPPDLIPITPLKSRCNKLKIYFCFLVPNLFSRTLPLTFFFSRFNSVEYSWIGETDWVYRYIVYISCKEQPSKVCKLLRKNQRDFCQYFKKGSALMF